jgi:putative transposase
VIVLQASTGRLYPTRAQAQRMARIGGQTRRLWNHWLGINTVRYEAEGKFAFYAEMSADLPELRKQPEYDGLLHRCAQMTVRKLDRALKDCFKSKAGRKGFPKFKSYFDRSDAFQFVGREVDVGDGRVKLPALGWVRVRGLRVPEGAKLFTATVRQAPCATGWEFAIQFEAAPPAVVVEPVRNSIAIDLGLDSLVTFSTAEKIPVERRRAKLLTRQRRLNRERDRRRKGSVNRRRTVERLARLHRQVKNARADHLHKLSRRIVDENTAIGIETLRVKGMMRSNLAGSLSDAGFGELRRQIIYKGEWAEREIYQHPTFARSTGCCPACGTVGPKLPIRIREWVCQDCGVVHDRDVAAAQWILRSMVGRGTPEPAAGMPRKRGSAVHGGDEACALSSHGGSPSNVGVDSCHGGPLHVSKQ